MSWVCIYMQQTYIKLLGRSELDILQACLLQGQAASSKILQREQQRASLFGSAIDAALGSCNWMLWLAAAKLVLQVMV